MLTRLVAVTGFIGLYLLIISGAASAQHFQPEQSSKSIPGIFLLDTLYYPASVTQLKATNDFDEAPSLYIDTLITIRYYYYGDDIQIVKFMRLNYYDCKQRLSKQEYMRWSGYNWDPVSAEVWEYSDLGKKQKYYLCEFLGWHPETENLGILPGCVNTRFEYTVKDEKNRIISRETFIYFIEYNEGRTEIISTDSIFRHEIRSYNYDENNRQVFYGYERTDPDGVLKNYSFISYNEDGLTIEILDQQWDPEENKMINSRLFLRSFHSYYKLEKALVQEWNRELSLWQNVTLTNYKYDAEVIEANLIELVVQYWDPGEETWINNRLNGYEWTSDNQQERLLVQDWNSNLNSWQNVKQTTWQYDADQNESAFLVEIWNGDREEWAPSERTITDYQGTAYLEEKTVTSYKWADEIGEWSENRRVIYKYNEYDYLVYYSFENYNDGWKLDAEQMISLAASEHLKADERLMEMNKELCMVTVSREGKNVLIWEKDDEFGIVSYNLYREGTREGQFDLIGSVPVDAFSVFVDNQSNPKTKSYTYKITASDECVESISDLTYSTLHLQISLSISAYNLNWNYASGNSDENIITYQILRGRTPDAMEVIDSVSASSSFYTDTNPPQDTIYYQIAGILESFCSPSGALKSSDSYNKILSNYEEVKEHISITELNKTDNFRTYPNPVRDKLFIQLEPNLSDPYTCCIYNVYGTLVHKAVDIQQMTYEIDTKLFVKGIYVIEVLSGSSKYKQKLIKL
jgi:hypothetical protein